MNNAAIRSFPTLDSFGAASILNEETKIYHTTTFETSSLGRIIDLSVALLSNISVDEHQLRLLFTILTAFANKKEPALIEFGVDKQKLVICFSFQLKQEVKLEGLKSRIENAEPSDGFEKMIVDLKSKCDFLIFKYQKGKKHVEIDCIVMLDKDNSSYFQGDTHPFTIAILESSAIRKAPRPSLYIDLGDSDYSRMYRKQGQGDNGIIIVDSSGPGSIESSIRYSIEESPENKEFVSHSSSNHSVQKKPLMQSFAEAFKKIFKMILPRVNHSISEDEDLNQVLIRLEGLLVQKETEFQKKQTSLEAEVRERTSQVENLRNALAKSKEKFEEISKKVEEVKFEGQYREKFLSVQVQLENSRLECVKLTEKVNSLTNKVKENRPAPANTEKLQEDPNLVMLRSKYEKVCSQLESLKKTNQQLKELLKSNSDNSQR